MRGPLLLAGSIGGFIACMVGILKPATSPIATPIFGGTVPWNLFVSGDLAFPVRISGEELVR